MKPAIASLVVLVTAFQAHATDPLFTDTPPFTTDAVVDDGETGDRLRREAEALAATPPQAPTPPSFAPQIPGASEFRLQQQLRDLAAFLKEQSARADFDEVTD